MAGGRARRRRRRNRSGRARHLPADHNADRRRRARRTCSARERAGRPGGHAERGFPGVQDEDANERQDYRIVAVVNGVQQFWKGVFERSGRRVPRRHGLLHRPGADGDAASPARRSGHCPRDQQIYIDLQVLSTSCSRASAPAARRSRRRTFSPASTDTTSRTSSVSSSRSATTARAPKAGRSRRSSRPATPESGRPTPSRPGRSRSSPRPTSTTASTRQPRSETTGSRADAGQVNPELDARLLGTRRRRWFSRGYEQGRPAVCDTFSGSI